MISVKIKNSVSYITLNDPKSKNSLSYKLIKDLNYELKKSNESSDIKCICIKGNENFFSSGANLKEVIEFQKQPNGKDDFIKEWEFLWKVNKPIIIGIQGYAVGGGLELSLMGDIICSTNESLISQPEIKVGLMPGCGGTQRLFDNIGYHNSMKYCLTGDYISGKEAFNLGIIQYIFEKNSFNDDLEKLCSKISSLPLNALINIKKSIKNAQSKSNLNDRISYERELFYECLNNENGIEGMSAFIEKRDAKFK